LPARRLSIRASHAIILAAWCGVLFIYGVSAGPLYRTESLRAIIGRECLNGNWLFPVLYGEPFLTKPPGHYAAIGLCSLPFGEVSTTTARLPSVLAAGAAVFLIYRLFRDVLNEDAALVAALVLPTSVLWLDKAPSAEIDMTLAGWVTASIVMFHRAVERDSTAAWLVALLCVAAGTLTKWTAPVFFYLTIVPFLAWRRELARLLCWKHLLACAMALVACGLWASAVAERVGWPVLVETIESEVRYRFATRGAGRNSLDVAVYPLIVLAAHLPLSGFALLTLRPGFWQRWDERGRRLLQLLHCWTWANLLFWSAVPNHNVRYALPMSAGLMGLGAMALIDLVGCMRPAACERGTALHHGRVRTIGMILIAGLLGLWLIVKVAFVEVAVPLRTADRNPTFAATALRNRVPADQPLYAFRLKDEGVMFSYGRPVVRLHDPRDLPSGSFAVLIRREWEDRAAFGHLQLVDWLLDQQGDPLILVQAP
jgi:4-amino-4-deoxy-L-arabinose transferase-like glycosyltransferase